MSGWRGRLRGSQNERGNEKETLTAVSNPKEISIISFLRSPSIVLGQPTTVVRELVAIKCSARMAALVLESSPVHTGDLSTKGKIHGNVS